MDYGIYSLSKALSHPIFDVILRTINSRWESIFSSKQSEVFNLYQQSCLFLHMFESMVLNRSLFVEHTYFSICNHLIWKGPLQFNENFEAHKTQSTLINHSYPCREKKLDELWNYNKSKKTDLIIIWASERPQFPQTLNSHFVCGLSRYKWMIGVTRLYKML